MNKEESLRWYNNEFENIVDLIKDKENLSHYDFLRIRNFKLQNSSRSEGKEINEVTKKSFGLAKKGNIEDAINELLILDGVGIPIASTILAMKYPEEYCIIDNRVIGVLGRKEWLKPDYNPIYKTDARIYKEYLEIMRGNAKKEGKKLRDYERELFEKSFGEKKE